MTFERAYTLSDLQAVAEDIVRKLEDHSVWLLAGQMGSGKTTLTKELLSALGVPDFKGSPTFSLINEYILEQAAGRYDKVYHFDLYRLDDIEEVWDIGWDDIMKDSRSLKIVEWPEKALDILPENSVSLTIKVDEASLRHLTIKDNKNGISLD